MREAGITVCIPVYNTDIALLKKAIENILVQSFQDFELIIINDASTNDAKNLILSYDDDRIRYYENAQSHGGPSKSRNIALENSQKEYIFFHDHDDYLYSPDALQTMYSNAQKDDLDILIFQVASKNNMNDDATDAISHLGLLQDKKGVFGNSDEDLLSTIFTRPIFHSWNKLFKVEFLLNNNLYFNENLKIIDDLEFFYRYILKANRIKVIDDVLYYYRQSGNSLSKTYWPLRDAQTFKIIREVILNLDLYERLKNDFLEFMLAWYLIFWEHTNEKDQKEYKMFIKNEIKEYGLTEDKINKFAENARRSFHLFTEDKT